MDQAKALSKSDDYLVAKASLTQTKERATGISTEIQHAADKVKGKGKTKVS